MKKKRKEYPVAPSEDFEECFISSGGCCSECDCGRVLFDGHNSYDWEEGELERLQKSAKAHPDKYIELPYAASRLHLGGREFVPGCPCNGARPYEDFIRDNAERIVQFLNKIYQERKQRAVALELAEKLAADFPPDPDLKTLDGARYC